MLCIFSKIKNICFLCNILKRKKDVINIDTSVRIENNIYDKLSPITMNSNPYDTSFSTANNSIYDCKCAIYGAPRIGTCECGAWSTY